MMDDGWYETQPLDVTANVTLTFSLGFSTSNILPTPCMKVHHPLLWQCLFALALSHVSLATHEHRQLPQNPTISLTSTTSTTSETTASTTATSTTTPLSTTTNQPTETPADTQTTTTAQQETTTTSTTSTSDTQTTTQPGQQTITSPVPIITSESAITTTNAAGDDVTITVTNTFPSTSSGAPSSTTTSNNSNSDEGKGLSTGSIVGMSVAAGVAVIGIVGFFVWKFTRKRFSDFDDNEAIKWPELNTHGGDTHPLPTRDTTRGGFETGSEADLSRVTSTSNYSTPDFGAGGPDPYAVPPLPHMNPNQPYRDDPASGYYDPYQGPMPGTLENGGSEWQPEAYPMTQLGGPPGRTSPAPVYEGGRSSPAVYAASPNPQAAYGGRSSPGPQSAYGRASPAPQGGYPAGRMSPGPHAAYGAR